MNLKFYKTQDCWFIDLPEYLEAGGDIADLQMVEGADTMLDELSNGGPVITLLISDTPYSEYNRELLLDYIDPEGYGSIYTDLSNGKSVYLCPVTLFVFGGEYPKSIYIKLPT